jgi:hypothetical protein
MPVNRPRNDDERLSSLLDGRLHGRSREDLLAHLSASEEDRRVFADTAAILRELEEEEAGAKVAAAPEVGAGAESTAVVIPLRPAARARWWRARAQWGALAAVLAAIAIIAALASRERASAAADPVSLAARLESDGGLPEGWAEQPRWVPGRGNGPTAEPAERAAQAARAGALLVDLALAVETRDTTDTRLLAEQVRSRFDPRSGDAGPLRQVAERAGAPADSLRPLVESATERLGDRLGREPLRLGAWAEAGRLAAHRRDQAFFQGHASRAALDRAERFTGNNPAARAAVARVRATIPAEGSPDWNALSAALDALLRELAS